MRGRRPRTRAARQPHIRASRSASAAGPAV